MSISIVRIENIIESPSPQSIKPSDDQGPFKGEEAKSPFSPECII